MSTEPHDIKSGESNCCGAPVLLGGICSDCKEHCEDVSVCQTCGRTGEVSTMERVYPNEPHMADIGTAPCPDCRPRKEEEYDNQDEG